jgi:hypothetical protein
VAIELHGGGLSLLVQPQHTVYGHANANTDNAKDDGAAKKRLEHKQQ